MENLSAAWMIVHDIKDKIAFNIPASILKTKRNYGARIDYVFKDGSILSIYPRTSRAVTRDTQGRHRFDFKLKINI